MTGPKTRRGGATWEGWLPDTAPIYKQGWTILSGKNLYRPSDKASTETSAPRSTKPAALPEADEPQAK